VKVESLSADGNINHAKVAFIADATNQLLKRSMLATDDILFSIAGTIGRVARVRESDLPANTNQAVAIVRPDPALIDSRYLFYCLRDGSRIDRARSRVVQSVQANLSLAELSSVEVPLPALVAQRNIAATLGILDDKVQSNRRAAKGLDKLSASIFTEWRQRHKSITSTTFGEFSDVFGGATPKTSVEEYWNGDIEWATPTDITALNAPYLFGTARRITVDGLKSGSAVLHPPGTILMTSRATIGSFAVNQVPSATNQGFIAVAPRRPEHRWFLFEEMRSRVPEMLDHANGSTFMELSRGNFKKLALDVPDTSALSELDSVLSPLHIKAAQMESENTRLVALLDLLLPALLSGRVHVPGVERA